MSGMITLGLLERDGDEILIAREQWFYRASDTLFVGFSKETVRVTAPNPR